MAPSRLQERSHPSSLFLRLLYSLLIAVVAFGQFTPPTEVLAAPSLTVTPITWNVVGLDSNNVNVGPSNFPVGARVCNTADAANNVTATFDFDDAGDNYTGSSYINLRAGSLSTLSIPTLAAGTPGTPSCHDFFFEVSVTRNTASYDKTRRYRINVSADTVASFSTSTPRELYVEHLVSQNRNAVNNIYLDGTLVPAGGSMNLMVGETYNIRLDGSTATNGYNQMESFINLTNTIFRVNTVTTTFTVSSLGSPYDRLYADACGWDNNPLSPTYRSCIGSDGKAGGTVTNTFNVTILGGSGSQLMSSLFYDFSGSSYHYNSDYSTSSRIVNITSPVTFAKAFNPVSVSTSQVSALTFTVHNPSLTNTIEDVDFDDTLTGGLQIATSPNPVVTGCGSSYTLTAAADTTAISFQNGSIAANTDCTVKVDVKATTNGTYPNTTGHLYINSVDTQMTASSTLTVEAASVVSLCGQTLATWTMNNGVTASMPNPVTPLGGNVSSATATISSGLSTNSIDASTGKPAAPSWKVGGGGFGTTATLDPLVDKYILFQVDTRAYYNITMSFHYLRSSSGPTKIAVYSATSAGGARASKTGATPLHRCHDLECQRSYPELHCG